MKTQWIKVAFLSAALTVAGCGGGGGSDDDDDAAASPTPVTTANARELAISSTSALEAARGGDPSVPALRTAAARVAAQSFTLSCADIGDTGSGISTNLSGNTLTINYNCTTISGQVTVTYSPNFSNPTSFVADYDNFFVDGDPLDFTLECTNIQSLSPTCSYAYNGLTGYDAGTFSYSGSTITGSGNGPYNGDLTVVDSDHGSFTVTASGITYGTTCSGLAVPISGTITLSGSGGTTATVTFSGCTATISIPGEAPITIDWNTL